MTDEVMKKSFINLTDPAIFQTYGGEEYWEKVSVPAGETVLGEGDGSDDFYYIFSGLVSVDKEFKSNAGLQRHLANLGQGDFFGEGSLLSDEDRGATVTASSDCILLKLSRRNFDRLVLDDPKAAVGLVLGIGKVLNQRLRVTNEKLAGLQ